MKKPVSCHQGKHRPVETNSKVPARASLVQRGVSLNGARVSNEK